MCPAARASSATSLARWSARCSSTRGSRPIDWLFDLHITLWLGFLVLGSGFDSRDLAAYAAGVLGAAVLDRIAGGGGCVTRRALRERKGPGSLF